MTKKMTTDLILIYTFLNSCLWLIFSHAKIMESTG